MSRIRGQDWTGEQEVERKRRWGEPENNDNNNTTVKTVRVTSHVNSDGTANDSKNTHNGNNLMIGKILLCVCMCVEGYTDTALYPGRNPRHWAKTSNPAAPAAPSALRREQPSPESNECPPGSCVPHCPSLTKLNFGKSLAN